MKGFAVGWKDKESYDDRRMQRNPTFGSCLWQLRSNNPSSMNICYKNCQQHVVFLYIVFLTYINIWCYNSNSWGLRHRSLYQMMTENLKQNLNLILKIKWLSIAMEEILYLLTKPSLWQQYRHFLTSCNQPMVFLSACFSYFYYTKKNITIRHEEMCSKINGTSFILKSCFNKVD